MKRPNLTNAERSRRAEVTIRAQVAEAARSGRVLVAGQHTTTSRRPDPALVAEAVRRVALETEAARRVAARSLNSKPKEASMNVRRLNTDATRYALPPDVPKAIAAIVKALALPPDADGGTVLAAVEALLAADASDPTAPANVEAAGRRLGLSAREIAMLKTMKVAPAKYVATKAAHGGGYKPRAKR